MAELRNPCGSIFKAWDGRPFVCQLSADHAGRHLDEGVQYETSSYVIQWTGDMRVVCQKCGGRTVHESICRACKKEICHDCLFEPEGRPRTWDDEHCKDCPAPEVKPYTLADLTGSED